MKQNRSYCVPLFWKKEAERGQRADCREVFETLQREAKLRSYGQDRHGEIPQIETKIKKQVTKRSKTTMIQEGPSKRRNMRCNYKVIQTNLPRRLQFQTIVLQNGMLLEEKNHDDGTKMKYIEPLEYQPKVFPQWEGKTIDDITPSFFSSKTILEIPNEEMENY